MRRSAGERCVNNLFCGCVPLKQYFQYANMAMGMHALVGFMMAQSVDRLARTLDQEAAARTLNQGFGALESHRKITCIVAAMPKQRCVGNGAL